MSRRSEFPGYSERMELDRNDSLIKEQSPLLRVFGDLEPDSKASCPCESPEGDLDASDRDEGGERVGKVLEVLGEASVPTEP